MLGPSAGGALAGVLAVCLCCLTCVVPLASLCGLAACRPLGLKLAWPRVIFLAACAAMLGAYDQAFVSDASVRCRISCRSSYFA